MEGLLFPIVMLAVGLVGGGICLLVLRHQEPERTSIFTLRTGWC